MNNIFLSFFLKFSISFVQFNQIFHSIYRFSIPYQVYTECKDLSHISLCRDSYIQYASL